MGFLDLLNDVTVWAASCFLGLVRFGQVRGKGKKEHCGTILWRLLLTGPLVGLLGARIQAVGLFLVLWPVLSKGIVLEEPRLAHGLDLTCTSFWAFSFLGCLFEQEGAIGWGFRWEGHCPCLPGPRAGELWSDQPPCPGVRSGAEFNG